MITSQLKTIFDEIKGYKEIDIHTSDRGLFKVLRGYSVDIDYKHTGLLRISASDSGWMAYINVADITAVDTDWGYPKEEKVKEKFDAFVY